MQELIIQGIQQKWEKSCFRCKKFEMINNNNSSTAYVVTYKLIT